MTYTVIGPALLSAPLVHRKIRQWRAAKALEIKNPRGIVDNGFVRIGGIEQWISIRGENRDNPVLLFVHGGPGSTYEMFTPIMRAWERDYTIVQWDQRGSGRTLGRSGKVPLSVDLLTADGLEVAEHVRQRLGRRPILVGSSFGSVIALRMAQARPGLFEAYLGTDQNITMAGDVTAALARLRAAGNRKGVAALEKLAPDWTKWSAKEWTASAKWTMMSAPGPNPLKTLLGPAMWFAPTMSLRDLKNLVTGMDYTQQQLYREFPQLQAHLLGMRYDLPFYLVQGADDVLTPADGVAEFFAEVDAPVKEMAVIPGAGHFAAFTHPREFLNHCNRLLGSRV